MKFTQTLFIDKELVRKYNSMMGANSVDYDANGINKYATVNRWTVNFGNGYEMDLKVCSANFDDPLWCEVVLFQDGCERECTDVSDDLLGDWVLETDGHVFCLKVQRKK